MIPPGMGHQQPLDPSAEVAVGVGADHQMEVVGHQAVTQEVHREPGGGVAHGVDEGVVVRRLVEDLGAAVAAVEDVIPCVGDRSSCSPGHATRVSERAPRPQY